MFHNLCEPHDLSFLFEFEVESLASATPVVRASDYEPEGPGSIPVIAKNPSSF